MFLKQGITKHDRCYHRQDYTYVIISHVQDLFLLFYHKSYRKSSDYNSIITRFYKTPKPFDKGIKNMSRNYLERINRLNQAVEAEEVSFEIYSRKIQSVLKKEARKQKAGYLPKQNDPQRLNLFKDEINWAMRDNAFWPIISVEMKLSLIHI